MKVTQVDEFRPGLRVKVTVGNGRERKAVVRWAKDETAGLYLLDPFSVEELGSAAKL
jgi:hypothetical protein